MDADFSHPPEIIKHMLESIDKADIVVGSWLIKGGGDLRSELIPKLFSRLVNILCQICFGSRIHTYTSGFILAKKSLFNDFVLSGDYGEYCIDFLVRQQKKGRRIIEVPFICVSREKGETKTSPNLVIFLNKGKGYIKTIFRLVC